MQRDKLSILLMEEAHVASVAEIAKQCFSEPWSEAAYRSELKNPQALTLVALYEEQVIGFLNCGFAADQVDLNTVAVSAQYRKCGVGRMLMTAMEEWIHGFASCVFLEVRCSNTPAQNLYYSLGYVECGKRPRYYHAPDEDGLIMKKDLTDEDERADTEELIH